VNLLCAPWVHTPLTLLRVARGQVSVFGPTALPVLALMVLMSMRDSDWLGPLRFGATLLLLAAIWASLCAAAARLQREAWTRTVPGQVLRLRASMVGFALELLLISAALQGENKIGTGYGIWALALSMIAIRFAVAWRWGPVLALFAVPLLMVWLMFDLPRRLAGDDLTRSLELMNAFKRGLEQSVALSFVLLVLVVALAPATQSRNAASSASGPLAARLRALLLWPSRWMLGAAHRLPVRDAASAVRRALLWSQPGLLPLHWLAGAVLWGLLPLAALSALLSNSAGLAAALWMPAFSVTYALHRVQAARRQHQRSAPGFALLRLAPQMPVGPALARAMQRECLLQVAWGSLWLLTVALFALAVFGGLDGRSIATQAAAPVLSLLYLLAVPPGRPARAWETALPSLGGLFTLVAVGRVAEHGAWGLAALALLAAALAWRVLRPKGLVELA
jgi:hypothetical protein